MNSNYDNSAIQRRAAEPRSSGISTFHYQGYSIDEQMEVVLVPSGDGQTVLGYQRQWLSENCYCCKSKRLFLPTCLFSAA